ncbi:TonB-dependent receptor [Hyphococcus sp. DH-69]|uniref:TonB-dependent receptor n=1 Tax=Hyphococcus formosus TaxID=3143534 RepID=UPI00398B0534
MSAAGLAFAQDVTTENVANASTNHDQVVVTASRREETLVETPIAVSAYGGEQLREANIQTFPDLVTQSPNVHFGFNGNNTNIAIRGIGTNLQGISSDPGVGFHVDGAYVADPGLALATLFDVKRVEVLRGPQGTLFGRNATGGAVNIISNTPTDDPEFGLSASAGLPAGEHVEGFASGPISGDGTLLGRIAFEQTYRRGDVKNIAPTGPRRLNDKNDFAGRLQFEWRPTDTFSARILGQYQESNTAGAPYYYAGQVAHDLPVPLEDTFMAKPGDSEIAVNQGEVKLMEWSTGLFWDWDIGFGSLSGTVTRRESENSRIVDGDGTAVQYIDYDRFVKRETTTAEILFSSDDSSRLTYILGANYYDDSAYAEGFTIVPFVVPFPIGNPNTVDTESYAFFGHAKYEITPAWKIFGGARYTKDKKQDTQLSVAGAVTAETAMDWSKPTFEVGTSYDFGYNRTGYVKYATGFKGGGFNNNSTFEPESNSMWELGLKGSYFDGLLTGNLALFRMNYENLQVYQIRFTVEDGSGSSVTNAAQATINGAEAEFALHLTPEFTLKLDGGWLDATFNNFITGDPARESLGDLDLSGNRLPNAPKFMVGIEPKYNTPLANGGELNLGVRFDWKSTVYFSEFNLPEVSQGPAGRLNAYANYTLPNGKWQVGLYGRNLTDSAAYGSGLVYSTVLNSMAAGTLQPSREFGIQVNYRY